jgi:hypothetical protein
MSVEDDLTSIAEAISGLQGQFVRSSSEVFLKTEGQATFKRLVVEAKAILDTSLGKGNDFSINLLHAVNAGSGGFFGGPSYACVGEAAELLRGAINHMRRQAIANSGLRQSAVNTPPPERRWLQITAQSRIGPPFGGLQVTLKSSSGSGGVWFLMYSAHTSSVTLPLLATQ